MRTHLIPQVVIGTCWYLLIAVVMRCAALSPLASSDHHKFLPGSLIRGHVVDLARIKNHAEIKIDEVLFGDASLVGQTFLVQTARFPMIKKGENTVWGVWEGYDSHLGSDGLKHYSHFVSYDEHAFAETWPIREEDGAAYAKMPSMASVLKRLEASKDWTEFNATLSRLCREEKDSYLAAWEKRLWQSCQGIAD